jgi:simple sugar transport system ATP-binding protein
MDDRGLPALQHIRFHANAGKVLGIAGVEGNGQSELVEVLTGLREYEGKITLAGVDLRKESTRFRRESGMAIIPENRKTQGLNLLGKISENLVANKYYQPPFSSKAGVISWKRVTDFAKDLIAKYDIRADGPEAVAGTLSGGNAQKIILARELSSKPVTLIAAHPTRGLDIAATQFVHQEIMHMRAENVAVLIISADLDELLIVSDRILVLFEGQIVGEVDPRTVTHEQLGLLMAGITENVL